MRLITETLIIVYIKNKLKIISEIIKNIYGIKLYIIAELTKKEFKMLDKIKGYKRIYI